jgi:hypothetical protein
VVTPREKFVRGWRPGQPGADAAIEPGFLLSRIVHRVRRPEAIRADITGDDQQITRRDLGKVTVLIAESDNPHPVIQTHQLAGGTLICIRRAERAKRNRACEETGSGLRTTGYGLREELSRVIFPEPAA